METLLSSVMQHLRSIMIACLTFMSKRCLSSHHKRLSVYNSAAMHIKQFQTHFVWFEINIYISLFFVNHIFLYKNGLSLNLDYWLWIWKLKIFGSVMLHHERPHTQFRLNETCLCTFWIVSLVVTHSDNEKIMFILE